MILSRQESIENDVDIINENMADEDLIIPKNIGQGEEIDSERSNDQSPDCEEDEYANGSPNNGEFKMDYNFSLNVN